MNRIIGIWMLAFCALIMGHPAPSAASQQRDRPLHSRFAGLVFAADITANTVWICPTGNLRVGFQPPTAQLQGVSFPTQLAIDAAGAIYVANGQINSSGLGSVGIYPRGQTSPSRTLTSGLNTATGVAVDSHGTVYVSNKFTPSVEVFPSGSGSPSGSITANLTGPDGLAVDRNDDLYIADSSARAIFKVQHGSMTPRRLKLSGLLRPIGVAVDAKRNLYVTNLDGAASNVAVYAPGAMQPSRTFQVPYAPGQQGIGEPMMASIGPDDMLIASTFISLWPIQGGWGGRPGAIVGFATGQSVPEWSGYGIDASDAVFQPES